VIHDHTWHDETVRWLRDGRLVKWTYVDGCIRVTDRPIPADVRKVIGDRPVFDKERSFFQVGAPVLAGTEQNDYYAFETRPQCPS
jgi:hypothetical protein